MLQANGRQDRGVRAFLLATAGVIAAIAPAAAFAQAAPAQDGATTSPPVPPVPGQANDPAATAQAVNNNQGSDAVGEGDVVVMARREAENVQNVPVSIQVVSGNTLQRLSITQSNELTKLAPGLNINQATANPNDTEIILRGVRYSAGSGEPAIPTYINDIPIPPSAALISLYDIGQVEVLRGPQGTTRGAASIAGALTFTTKRPDLDSVGGYGSFLLGTLNHLNAQAALNVPIIKDKLAIRVAGSYEDTDGNNVRSIYNSTRPYLTDWSARATVLFQPTDTISVTGMYQHHDRRGRFFQAVDGTGSPGLAALGVKANYNGPAISGPQFESVQELASTDRELQNLETVNASWEVLGHRLSYNFGALSAPSRGAVSVDLGNAVPGFDRLPTGSVDGGNYRVHEVRLSSIRGGHLLDYDLGYFHQGQNNTIPFGTFAYLPGAFGAPFVTQPGVVTTPVARYTLQANSVFRIKRANDSFYGNAVLHLGENTELTGGLRYIRDRIQTQLNVTTSSAFVTFPRFVPAAFGGCPSPFLPNSPVYGPNFCDFQIAANATQESPGGDPQHKLIYNASLSHRFNESILAYATVGTSFRLGLPAINNTGLPSAFLVPKPEKATSYEVGVKTSVARWLRLNADVFQINYDGQLTQINGVPYYNSVSQSTSQTSLAFYYNVDARVRGVEAEIHLTPIRNLSLNGNLSYARIESRGGLIPCNQQATNPVSATNPINLCQNAAGQSVNPAAPLQLTANGSYNVPISFYEGYFRFNVNHSGRNPAFGVADDAFTANRLTTVDLYTGLTGNNGGWDLGFYVKNAFDKVNVLTSTTILNTVYPSFGAPLGYSAVSLNSPREIGLSLRVAFGSR